LTPAIATACSEFGAGAEVLLGGTLDCRTAAGRIAGINTYARGAMRRTASTATTTRTSRATGGRRNLGILIVGRRRRGHAIDGTATRGSSGFANLGSVISGIFGIFDIFGTFAVSGTTRGSRRVGASGAVTATGTIAGSGTGVAQTALAGDDSIGPPQRSHQISMPRLG
jgi:hypothetical protein